MKKPAAKYTIGLDLATGERGRSFYMRNAIEGPPTADGWRTFTPGPLRSTTSRLRLAWWRLCAWFREAVR
jgi:hypothetical protein